VTECDLGLTSAVLSKKVLYFKLIFGKHAATVAAVYFCVSAQAGDKV
jgi:hypothetical protein